MSKIKEYARKLKRTMVEQNNDGNSYPVETIQTRPIPGHDIPLKAGDIIHHKFFGEGTVLSVGCYSPRDIFEVDFKDCGVKKLSYSYAARSIAETADLEAQREAARAKWIRETEAGKASLQREKARPVSNTMNVCGYPFHFVQILQPRRGADGKPKEFYPELDPGKRLNINGDPPFCRFSIDAEPVSGVYLWVVDDEIIYIGETVDLRKRFNSGYGRISAYNCYQGGRSTNCKMNKVVLNLAKQGRYVKLYFYETDDYKNAELTLLSRINTKYNVKDN